MEGFNSSTLKYALVGLGAVAMGVAVYYLSQDDTKKLDTKKYTKEKLKTLLEETMLEYTCILCRNYNVMMKMQENLNAVFGPKEMAQLKQRV